MDAHAGEVRTAAILKIATNIRQRVQSKKISSTCWTPTTTETRASYSIQDADDSLLGTWGTRSNVSEGHNSNIFMAL